jgi:hypothetical protein
MKDEPTKEHRNENEREYVKWERRVATKRAAWSRGSAAVEGEGRRREEVEGR